MLELRNRNEFVWDEILRPLDKGPLDKEPFSDWWQRNLSKLKHLHREIAEQWIYRHWGETKFHFLRLEALSWRSEIWTTDQVLSTVHLEWGTPMNPEHDYKNFAGNRSPAQAGSARVRGQ